LRGGGATRSTLIHDPEVLVGIKSVPQVDRRRQVRIIVVDVNVFGGIEAVEIHELYASSQVQVQLVVLNPDGSRYPVGIGGELVGITEQAVELGKIFFRTVVVVGIVDRGALVIAVIIAEQHVNVLAQGLRVVQGWADGPTVQGIVIVLVDVLDRIQFIKCVV
jgi:hypothetical protein